MKKIIFIFLILSLLIGCKEKNYLLGKIFIYQDGPTRQTVAFDGNKLLLKWEDQYGKDAIETEYNLKKDNDTLFTIELKQKPKYWQKNTWQIVMKDENEFYSLESKKVYKLSSK